MINAPGFQVSIFRKFLIADKLSSRICIFFILMLACMPSLEASSRLLINEPLELGSRIGANRHLPAINNPFSSQPLVKVKVPDLPKFVTRSIPAARYDEKYIVTIKLSSAGSFDTKISAVKKPDWLSLRSQPFVQTLAGADSPGILDGVASAAQFRSPYGLAVDTTGNIYVADRGGNCIRKIDSNGKVTTIAGENEPGYRDGAGSDARFDSPSGIAVDKSGNIYVSDQNNNCIRKINQEGVVTTYAGNEASGYADGVGRYAKFKSPGSLVVNDRGYLYVTDSGNNLIRMINPSGEVTTLAGNGSAGFADGDGTNAMFNVPVGITIGTMGDIYVCDQLNNRIRKITPLGQVSTLAGKGEPTYSDGEGLKSAFYYPTGITSDGSGSLYITDQLNHLIRRINDKGVVSTIAGSEPGYWEGTGNFAKFKNPVGICFNKEGDLLVGDLLNFKIRQIVINPVLLGTPAKSDVGFSDILLQADNESGSQIQTLQLTVLDDVSPQIVSRIPANKGTNVDYNTELFLTFSEEVMLSDTGSITTLVNGKIFKKHSLALPEDRAKLNLSSDGKTLNISNVGKFPGDADVVVAIGKGAIVDLSHNAFNGSDQNSWSFLTKSRKDQSIDIKPLSEKIYGDSTFILGPVTSSSGLPITYTTDDSTILSVQGNYARILNAGRCNVIAAQQGNEEYNSLNVRKELIVHPRRISVQPDEKQYKTYGEADPQINYSIISGQLANGDKFSGSLSRARGDSCGVYSITAGDLSLGHNYELVFHPANFEIKKSPLYIRAVDQVKIAGERNPHLTVKYTGFQRGDSTESLSINPVISSLVHNDSPPGNYEISIYGAAAKNYDLFYENGIFKVSYPALPDIPPVIYNVMENQPANTLVGLLPQSENNDVKHHLISYSDLASPPFKIQGDSILTTTPLDYEHQMHYSLQVQSVGIYGNTRNQNVTVAVRNVNEMPFMDPIDKVAVCTTGTILLHGIVAGPERDQIVSASITSPEINLFKTLTISEVSEGEATVSYSIGNTITRKAMIRIVLKDNGGIEKGGIDSNVYNYELNFIIPPKVSITSNRDGAVAKGEQVLLTATGSGIFTWFNKDGTRIGNNSAFLRVNPNETETYKVAVISESGCVNEAEIRVVVRESLQVVCYNVITPNEDGKNDYFTVKNIDLYPQNVLKVYDKTGTIVFNQRGYSNNWKATYKGMPLPEATYYYLLDLGPGKEKLKGFIAVVDDW